jgi:hypothetical protein
VISGARWKEPGYDTRGSAWDRRGSPLSVDGAPIYRVALPLLAKLQRICGGGAKGAWRGARLYYGGEACLALQPMA